MAKPKNTSHSGAGQLRIIAGEWRSRKLDFPHVEGLRPTPDRVRETLFNWLAPYIQGARVLDVFAGSGALFLEALSRGAAKGLALDSNREAISNIRENMGILRCTTGQVQQTDALRYLDATPSDTFDVVFLDPPFNKELLKPACDLLEQRGWLTDDAWIYTESELRPSELGLPGNWRLHREQKAGGVNYALWQRDAGQAPAAQ
ncbi:16S rRNA (guanine(966)-N(2))-methyltransferase RsmD [Pseudomonas helleri]|jgi:16S rRNA (guanine966-N2)-methyltransferase|uniref:Ribosomal RNA small subunit methyltransferase D n=1 Tax=Pseudomonas helleri TaxID=1608996 RepID=A0A0J6I786_9PSED|nr:16S rRNA (guanine(966)-N(2))-methyltransferase RsmD [Pseudomonas helleri]KMN08343.1 16S rRNA methyltransferase [Pseudomonas helleri]MQT32588.1 16S rRNA (guanine(966)-N(2))-methyltransferase RsmD [Pseudomonas helleri]MQT46046.1 16S rRNA (guanine(966)-N(2))-methyltransferase RsmD [Pseudomonas helleri]MQT88598.1 16S rRNA (guanine(966)-N(2))-methyltransferase RsmD [Pseudomonas helleri]MQU06583.1 16S rRNA (guanine(966)-N(2))-methyltransferase RsmD [Pseudomonas helleri]